MLDIRNCNNKDLLLELEDNSIDLAIVDPPYNIKRLSVKENRTEGTKYRKSMAKMCESANKWNHMLPDDEYYAHLFRVSKHQIIWGANNFTLPPSEYFCIWNKHQTVDNFASAEYAWVSPSLKKPAKVFEYPIHKHNAESDKIHPTQKPVALYKWLLSTYAKPGFKILDTHLGSGSIAIACHDYGFDLTACELDKDYYEAAMKRINAHVAQQKLFV